MKHFYAKFIEVYKIKEPSIVQPIYITDENGKKLNKTNSSKVSQAEINEEIKKLKKNHQSFEGFNPDDKMHHD
jgi:hypothetical protein